MLGCSGADCRTADRRSIGVVDVENDKHRKFVAAYLKNQSGHDAAIAAGYSAKTADQAASRLLRNAKIRAAIEKALMKLELSADRVLQEIKLHAFSNMQDYTSQEQDGLIRVNIDHSNRDQMAAIQELTVDETGGSGDGERKAVQRVRFKLTDKTKNLEMLAKHFELLTEKVKVSGDPAFFEAAIAARARAKK